MGDDVTLPPRRPKITLCYALILVSFIPLCSALQRDQGHLEQGGICMVCLSCPFRGSSLLRLFMKLRSLSARTVRAYKWDTFQMNNEMATSSPPKQICGGSRTRRTMAPVMRLQHLSFLRKCECAPPVKLVPSCGQWRKPDLVTPFHFPFSPTVTVALMARCTENGATKKDITPHAKRNAF